MHSKRSILCILLAALVLASCAPAAPEMAASEPVVEEAGPAQEMQPQFESHPSPIPTAAPRREDNTVPSTGGMVPPNDQPAGDMFFEDYGVNPRIDTLDDSFSTFAVDVDTGAYTVMRRYITDGFLPPDESVRVEEFINYFDQQYEAPEEDAFAIHLEGGPMPYGNGNYQLVQVGLQGYEISSRDRDDVVLTFVIDVSGSMDRENRLELVKESLELLVDELRPSDEVGIVIYGSRGEVVLDHTPVSNRRKILRAIRRLSPGGSTYAEEGLQKAYRLAWEAYDPNATNRVILCSDGVANVGSTGPDAILESIRKYAEDDIYLTTIGVGMGNYNDVLMEQLANDGDGFYAYVDTLDEAERVFVDDLTSTLQVIAKDAKIQVEFNPDVISRYRLLGYENRDVADEDFRNNEVDAGEIGAGHSVTALYEVKFEPEAPSRQPALTVHVRYEDPEFGDVVEIYRSIAKSDFLQDFEENSPRFQLTAIVASYAEILRNSYWAKEYSLEDVAWDARRIARMLREDEDVQEFAELADEAVYLSDVR